MQLSCIKTLNLAHEYKTSAEVYVYQIENSSTCKYFSWRDSEKKALTIFSLERFQFLSSLGSSQKSIQNFKFDTQQDELVFLVREDGSLEWYDLRSSTSKPQLQIQTIPSYFTKNDDYEFTSVDIWNQNNFAVSYGSHFAVGDVRSLQQKKFFEDFHSLPIKTVKFCSDQLIISAGDDGCLNFNDWQQSFEDTDDALIRCINCEDGIEQFGFFGPQKEFCFINTQVQDLKLYLVESATQIGTTLHCSSIEAQSNYFIGSQFLYQNNLFSLLGSNQGQFWIYKIGLSSDRGTIFENALQTAPSQVHSSVIRSFATPLQSLNWMLLGGEDGIISLWQQL